MKIENGFVSKRILHIADAWEGGGAESVFRMTVKVSRELNFSTRVFHGEDHKRTILGYMFSISSAWKLFKVLKDFDPDVVHIHNYYHKLSPGILAAVYFYKNKTKKLRVIFTAHDMHLISPNSGFQYFANGQPNNISIEEIPVKLARKYDNRSHVHSIMKILQHVFAYRILKLHRVFDLVITPSKFLKSLIHSHYPQLNVQVIRNPVVVHERTKIHRLDVNDMREIRLVFFGRLSAEKGLYDFVRVIEPLLSEDYLTLDIYGEGPELTRLRNLIQELKVSRNVELKGKIDPLIVQQRMAEYSVLVLPSTWYENAPLVICEAASAGLPVLVRDLGGAKELAEETKWGIANSLNSVIEIKALIDELARHSGENELLDAGKFSEAQYISKINDIYSI